MARPSKLTPELQSEICELLTAGNYVETAAASLGVHKSTLYDWLAQGEKDIEAGVPSPHADFTYAVDEARANAEIMDLAAVRTGQDNWQARAWMLERRTPGRWGRRQAIEHTGQEGGPVEIKLAFDPDA